MSGSRRPPDGGAVEWLRWLLTTEHSGVRFVREVLSSVAIVALVGVVLFGMSGVWPPLVAVESGSMQPHMARGDLVFVMEEHRLAPRFAHEGTGVVPAAAAKSRGYRKFGGYGDVIVYHPDGRRGRPPIIHRAMFWVEDGENWYAKANSSYIQAAGCGELAFCPAPHAGFITKGDNMVSNRYYDQSRRISGPVRPRWIKGTAEVRIPLLGYVRLLVSEGRGV